MTVVIQQGKIKNSDWISKLNLKTSTWRTASTIVYALVFLALGISVAWIGPALPNLSEHIQTGLAAISIIFTARYLGVMTGIIFGGRVYDRQRGHPIITIMMFMLAALTVLVSISSSLWQLGMLFALLGFAGGTIDVGGNTLLAWLHRNNVGPYMNGLHVFFGLGAIIAPVLFVRLFLHGGSLLLPLLVFAVILLLPGVGLIFLRSPEPEPSREITTSRNGMRHLILLVGAFLFMYVGAEVSINGWIFTYSLKMNMASEVSAAYLTSVFWIFITIGRLAIIPFYSYVRSRTILITNLIGGMAFVCLILFAPKNTAALWIGIAGAGFFMGPVFPTTLSLLEERIGTTGRRTSLFLVGASIGAMVFPWMVGQLFGLAGPIALVSVVFVALLAAFGLLGLVIHALNQVDSITRQSYEY